MVVLNNVILFNVLNFLLFQLKSLFLTADKKKDFTAALLANQFKS